MPSTTEPVNSKRRRVGGREPKRSTGSTRRIRRMISDRKVTESSPLAQSRTNVVAVPVAWRLVSIFTPLIRHDNGAAAACSSFPRDLLPECWYGAPARRRHLRASMHRRRTDHAHIKAHRSGSCCLNRHLDRHSVRLCANDRNPQFPVSRWPSAAAISLLDHGLGRCCPSAGRPLYWHLDSYPSTAAPRRTKVTRHVIESGGKAWLLTIEQANWRPKAVNASAASAAAVGEAEHTPAVYLRHAPPGFSAPVHRHAEPEAVFALAGELCVETTQGRTIERPAAKGHVIARRGWQLTVTGNAPHRRWW